MPRWNRRRHSEIKSIFIGVCRAGGIREKYVTDRILSGHSLANSGTRQAALLLHRAAEVPAAPTDGAGATELRQFSFDHPPSSPFKGATDAGFRQPALPTSGAVQGTDSPQRRTDDSVNPLYPPRGQGVAWTIFNKGQGGPNEDRVIPFPLYPPRGRCGADDPVNPLPPPRGQGVAGTIPNEGQGGPDEDRVTPLTHSTHLVGGAQHGQSPVRGRVIPLTPTVHFVSSVGHGIPNDKM